MTDWEVPRRWQAGQEVEVEGIRYVAERGYKAPGDLRLVMYAPERCVVPISLLGVTADFLSENEDHLRLTTYRRNYWKETGPEHLSRYLTQAMEQGYALAQYDKLKLPKRRLKKRGNR